MFAGPNGSGKTTIKTQLNKPAGWFGIDIDPDALEATVRQTDSLPLAPFELTTDTAELQNHFRSSPLLQKYSLLAPVENIVVNASRIDFQAASFNSYFASVLADFLRRKALSARKSFTFETVMSAPDKVDLLQKAQACGYRTYLYYIATEDPAINVQRVKNRVADGGHDVPEDKIIGRYARSLGLLSNAIRYANRAFLFDTSSPTPWYFAEITDGTTLEPKSEQLPLWFGPVWTQLFHDDTNP